MKVLFHINSLGLGGAERVVSILARELSDQAYDVVLATEWDAEKEYPLDERVKRIHVGLVDADDHKSRITKAFLRLFRLRKAIKDENPDCVISFCNKANFRAAYAMFGLRNKLVVSVRNDPKRDYAPYKFPTKFMERKAAGCVFQTPDAKSFFTKKLQDKGTIILNPLDPKYANLSERKPLAVSEQTTENGREKVIVCVGRISEQKNHMLLVKAFHEIAASYPDYELQFYGDVQTESCYHKLQEYVSENGLEKQVLFCGSSQNLVEIRNAALFVLPSDYEGMPNALIEAMVMGIPSISTDCPCGGSKMLIKEGENGMLVPVKDVKALKEAMVYMLEHPKEAEQMGLEAEKLRERVKSEKIASEWDAYLKGIV